MCPIISASTQSFALINAHDYDYDVTYALVLPALLSSYAALLPVASFSFIVLLLPSPWLLR